MDDFDADVLEALVAERERPCPVGLEGKQRVLERVAFSALGAMALGAAGLAHANAGAASGAAATATEGTTRAASGIAKAAWLKLVGVSVIAFASGVGTHAIYMNRAATSVASTSPPPPIAAPLPSISAAPSAASVPEVAVSSLPEAPRPALTAAPTSPSSASASKDEPAQLRPRERSLLEAAQSALARGESGEALSLVERHAREFPKSELGEEREALRIRALARGGRCDEAKSARTAFVTRFPASLQRGALERLCPPVSP